MREWPALPYPDIARRLSVQAAAREAPDVPAIVEPDGTVHTFPEVAARARAVIASLQADGVTQDPGGRVAFDAAPNVESLITLYALVELGIPAVPVHPKLTAPERRALLERARVSCVLDAAEMARRTASARQEDVLLPAPADSSSLALVHTSGSSGAPKHVALSRTAFAAAADASGVHLGWTSRDRWLLCMPLAHVGGLSIPVRTLMARRTVVLAPLERGFDAASIGALAAHREVTLMSLVPTMLTRLLDARPRWTPSPHLRAVLVGGAAASPTLVARAIDRGVPVLTTYGLTETCGQVTTQLPVHGEMGASGAGSPLPGTALRIGADGGIEVRSVACADRIDGEHGSSWTADGWLRTGDAGVLDVRGRLHVRGRLDARIVTGGENVDPLEVEHVLETLRGVRAACVFGIADDTWGNLVAAAIVPERVDAPPEPSELHDTLRTRLARHKRPRRIAFVERLPEIGPGKVDRTAAAGMATPHLVPLSAR